MVIQIKFTLGKLKIVEGHICNNLKGRSKTSNGFIWKYKI